MLAPAWQQTDQVVIDTAIGPLIAAFDEFSKEAGNIVAPLEPALEEVGEIGIKLASLLTRFAFRKRASCQPALHRPEAYPDLPGNGLLTLALLVQSDHLLVMSQMLLTPGLLEPLLLWGGANRLFGWPNRCQLIECGLCLTFALSRQMMRQKA